MNREWLALSAALVGCVEPPEVGEPASGWSYGGDPIALHDEAAERGLDFDQDGVVTLDRLSQSGLVASDLDADGDIDLLLGRRRTTDTGIARLRPPIVLENDGAGHFTERPFPVVLPDNDVRATIGFAAVDVDGDRLPEIFCFGHGFVAEFGNLGDMRWGDGAWVLRARDDAVGRYNTMAFGDVDGDHQLELLAVSLGRELPPEGIPQGDGGAGVPEATPHRLFRRADGGWEEARTFGRPGWSQMAVFTDRDDDGDVDLFLVSEFGNQPGAHRSAFYENDDGQYADIATSIGADIQVGGMGMVDADLNDDGLADYCITQFGPVVCLASNAAGYLHTAAAWGLTQATSTDNEPPWWSGYSMEVADLDADGYPELAATAGNPAPNDDSGLHFDRLWRGEPGPRWTEVGEALGFDDPRHHFGVAAADFDADGRLDLAVSGGDGPPRLWMNRGAAAHAILVRLDGVRGNVEGHGAVVFVEAGGRRQRRTVTNVRALGQGPAEAHFGLGAEDRIDRIEVRWPDGAVSIDEDVQADRIVRVAHPDRS